MLLLGLILFWILCGFAGGKLGSSLGRNDGFIFGFLLGPLGVLILWVICFGSSPKKEKEERERRWMEQRRAEERHEAQLAEMRALVDTLTPKQNANSPKSAPIKFANDEEWYWVKHFVKDKEHGPITRSDLLDLFSGRKIDLDTLVARERGESQKEFQALGEEIPGLKMLAENKPPRVG